MTVMVSVKNPIAAVLIVSGLAVMVYGTGLMPLSLLTGTPSSLGEWTAELQPLSPTKERLTITTDYRASYTEKSDWINVRYALQDASANCKPPELAYDGIKPGGWTAQLPQPIARITAPGTYTYDLDVVEGKPVYVGLWLATDEIDDRTGIPWNDYGNEPYCSGPTAGEFSGGAFSFTSTWHWAFPEYEYAVEDPAAEPDPAPTTEIETPEPEPIPVSQPEQRSNILIFVVGLMVTGAGGVVWRV
jgi:hypothetical protein